MLGTPAIDTTVEVTYGSKVQGDDEDTAAAELREGSIVEVTLPDGSKTQGAMALARSGRYWVATGDGIHKDVEHSDIRLIR